MIMIEYMKNIDNDKLGIQILQLYNLSENDLGKLSNLAYFLDFPIFSGLIREFQEHYDDKNSNQSQIIRF